MTDFDKGGNDLQRVRTFYGPSVGWLENLNPAAVQATINNVLTSGGGGGGNGGGSGWPNTINVKDSPFNAVGDGIADDTAALNAAFASVIHTHAFVLIPNGNYKITDTVVIGDQSGGAAAPASYISLYAPGGPEGCFIKYSGPTDGRPALRFAKNKYFIAHGIALTNTGAMGSSVGIQLGGAGTGSFGNQVINPLFSEWIITNFFVGTTDGNFGAASETNWINCTWGGCQTGFVMNDFNSLDHTFLNLGGGGCFLLIDTGVATGAFNVLGGSNSQSSGATFKIRQNCTTFTIRGMRDEESQLVVSFATNGGHCALDTVDIVSPARPDGLCIACDGTGGRLGINNCNITGNIHIANINVTITNSSVLADLNTRLPFLFRNNGFGTPTRVYCVNNIDTRTSPAAPLDDFIGTVGYTEFTGGGVFNVNMVQPQFLRKFQDRPPANTGSPYGGDYLQLSNVRALAEGPVAGPKNMPTVDLVTTAATAAGGTVLTFASVPNFINPFWYVQDITTGAAISFNTRVASGTATTLTLDTAVAAPGVGLGDTMRFRPNTAVPNGGKNLRVTGKFAASATLAFTFQRNLTANSGGLSSRKLTATVGTFFPTDVGKAIKLVGGASGGWTDTFGFIVIFTDSTHIEYESQFAQPNVPTFNGTITIGADEPDANYVVAGLCGNANETFWVDNITTSGFTLHSSNAASNATVTALIVR